jgi:hypothetical protein
MHSYATRLLSLAICTAATVALVTTTEGEAKSRHIRKHPQPTNLGFNDSWPAEAVRPAVRPSGWVCPGMARSFDCKIWPPPFEDDPDRKNSGSDGG